MPSTQLRVARSDRHALTVMPALAVERDLCCSGTMAEARFEGNLPATPPGGYRMITRRGQRGTNETRCRGLPLAARRTEATSNPCFEATRNTD